MPSPAQAKKRASKRSNDPKADPSLSEKEYKVTRFVKKVVSPGTYFINGKSRELTADDLKQLVSNGAKMLAKGIQIPAPFAHADREGQIPAPVNMSNGGVIFDSATNEPIGWNSELNAGFAVDFEYREGDDEGVYAEFEIAGSEDDASSPAGKVGKTIKETSAGFIEGWTDGNGETYEGLAPLHVAVVNNPVESNQGNFALAMNNTMLMAFSDQEASDDPRESNEVLTKKESPLDEALSVLQSLGVEMPEGIEDPMEFISTMTLLLKQKAADQSSKTQDPSNSELSKAPSGGSAPNSPIAMNQTKLDPADFLMSSLVMKKREALTDRLNKLAARKNSAKESREKLATKIASFVMSVATLSDEDAKTIRETGDLPRWDSIEDTLEALEESAGEDLTSQSSDDQLPEGEPADDPRYDAAAKHYESLAEGGDTEDKEWAQRQWDAATSDY